MTIVHVFSQLEDNKHMDHLPVKKYWFISIYRHTYLVLQLRTAERSTNNRKRKFIKSERSLFDLSVYFTNYDHKASENYH